MKAIELARSQSRNSLKVGLASLLLAVGGAQAAEAKSTEFDQAAQTKARQLAGRIAAQKSVGIDPNHVITWRPSAARSCQPEPQLIGPKPRSIVKCETDIPLTATVNGRKGYFVATQVGKKLSTIRVTPIPTDAIIDIAPSPLTIPDPDNPFAGYEHVATTHATLELSGDYQPITGVTYEDPRLVGGLALIPVSQTTVLRTPLTTLG